MRRIPARSCRSLSLIDDAFKNQTKNAIAFLVGLKYDQFAKMESEEQEAITTQARRFAKAMGAPLVYISAFDSINVNNLFKILVSKAFGIRCTLKMVSRTGLPILEY